MLAGVGTAAVWASIVFVWSKIKDYSISKSVSQAIGGSTGFFLVTGSPDNIKFTVANSSPWPVTIRSVKLGLDPVGTVFAKYVGDLKPIYKTHIRLLPYTSESWAAPLLGKSGPVVEGNIEFEYTSLFGKTKVRSVQMQPWSIASIRGMQESTKQAVAKGYSVVVLPQKVLKSYFLGETDAQTLSGQLASVITDKETVSGYSFPSMDQTLDLSPNHVLRVCRDVNNGSLDPRCTLPIALSIKESGKFSWDVTTPQGRLVNQAVENWMDPYSTPESIRAFAEWLVSQVE